MDLQESFSGRNALETQYKADYPLLLTTLDSMHSMIKNSLDDAGLFPTYKKRVKSFSSYFAKKIKFIRNAATGNMAPLPITDMIAVRVVCPFIGDLDKVEEVLSKAFSVREVEHKGSENSFKEFGYESIHVLLDVPQELRQGITLLDPPVCEVQIRTFLQDAWAEVEHELVYKAEFTPFDEPMKRKLAALNANLTLSDMLFQEIRDYQHQLTNELAKRRVAFFKKIEDSIDKEIDDESLALKNSATKTTQNNNQDNVIQQAWKVDWKSLDDFLLEALNAHNRADYKTAIEIYSHILSLKPKTDIKALIYKHRGMAYFAESCYDEASQDFSAALDLDSRCYKAAYYRGVVNSVKQNYICAIDDFNLALSIHPYHFYSTYRRAQAYFHLEDYPKALSDCETAMDLEPNNEALKKLKELVSAKLKM